MMGLMYQNLSVFHFDHTYKHQQRLQKTFKFSSIDLEDIRGTNLYCDPMAQAEIIDQLKIQGFKPGITFIGSGNYHYATYLLLSQIQEPFTLCLVDHHTDMNDHGPHTLTCGSWVLWALEHLENMKHVLLIGPKAHQINTIDRKWRRKVTLIPENQLELSQLDSFIPTDKVYLSIDKDVLGMSSASTQWSQGEMTLETLTRLVRVLLKETKILGADICGEWAFPETEAYYPKNQLFNKKNEAANTAILTAIMEEDAIPNQRDPEHDPILDPSPMTRKPFIY